MEKSHDDMVRKRSHLSAEEKYQIFLEAAMVKGNGSISCLLSCVVGPYPSLSRKLSMVLADALSTTCICAKPDFSSP